MTFHTFKLELEADEKAIRSFYSYFYWNSTRDGSWLFDIQLETIEHYLSIFEEDQAIIYADSCAELLFQWVEQTQLCGFMKNVGACLIMQ